MSEDIIELTVADFQRIEWQVIDPGEPDDGVEDYANQYYGRASEAQREEDLRAAGAYRILADLCSFRLRLGNPDHPFHPYILTETTHSARPDDIPRQYVEVLRELVPEVVDTKLRARMADFVWASARGYPAATTAVEAYLDLAEPLKLSDPEWPVPMDHLERALQIAISLSRNSSPYDRVSNFILDLVRSREESEGGFLSKMLLTLAANHRLGDAAEMYAIAAKHALRAQEEGAWHRAEQYWLVAAQLGRSDREMHREACLRLSDCYVARARADGEQPHVGPMLAASSFQRAIEALRRGGGFGERVDELHREMMEYQRRIPESMTSFSTSIDISGAVAASRAAVSGKPLGEALLTFAFLGTIPKYADLLQTAEDNAERYIFKSLFPAVQLNSEGKVVDRQGSTDTSDPAQRLAALRKDMFHAAQTYQNASTQASIDPARRRIIEDHGIRPDDFFWIVSNNPLVPAGREMLYAEAFSAGFYGDLPKAVSILVHQLEHSFRQLLATADVLPTTISKEGIQSERNLNSLLYEPQLKEFLGEDIVFALQGLLVEKFGSNIRNSVAHGLMAYNDFFDYSCLYLWWLSFRLVCLPMLGRNND